MCPFCTASAALVITWSGPLASASGCCEMVTSCPILRITVLAWISGLAGFDMAGLASLMINICAFPGYNTVRELRRVRVLRPPAHTVSITSQVLAACPVGWSDEGAGARWAPERWWNGIHALACSCPLDLLHCGQCEFLRRGG